VIAIKQNVELCPWADMVYGCDAAWWRYRRGLPEFMGLKVSWSGNGLSEYPDIKRINIAPGKREKYTDDLQFETGTVGGGGNSGFQALNLAMHLGSRHVILIGFDMDDRSGKHWYGRNHWPMSNNPDQSNFRRWIPALAAAAIKLEAAGIQVVNASPASALKCFPFQSIEQALTGWDAQAAVNMDRVRSA
jgi:hypothetical protein